MAVQVKTSLSRIATDPFRNFRFVVKVHHPTVGGWAKLGFMGVTGLAMTTEVIPYREGGMNTTTQKMPGQSDFSPITLSRGVGSGSGEMWSWMSQLFTVIQGVGTGRPDVDFRCNVDIKVLEHPVTSKERLRVKNWYKIYNAWPTSVSFSDLDAGANAIIVQQMTLAHEGFDVDIATRGVKDLKKFNPGGGVGGGGGGGGGNNN